MLQSPPFIQNGLYSPPHFLGCAHNYFEEGSHYVDRLVLTLPFSCLSLPNAGITDVYHQAQILITFKKQSYLLLLKHPWNGFRPWV